MRNPLGGGTKKLLIALQVLFGQWRPEGGTIECWDCRDEIKTDCRICEGKGILEFSGPANRVFPELDFDDALTAVWLAYTSRERQWTPISWLSEPAAWAHAFLFLRPFLEDQIEQMREKEIEKARQQWQR